MMRSGSKRLTRLCTLLLVVALLCVCGAAALAVETDTVNEPVCYTHGDVNGDGVIDNRDAIYTLYSFLYGDEEYPLEQDWDFNSDGEHSNKDAIYVLYASLYTDDPDYQLKGFVHSYYDPAWEWTVEEGVVTAKVAFKCGCGEDHEFVTEEGGVSVSSRVKKEATCLDAGVLEHVASIEFDGKEYTSSKTEAIPTLRHEMDGFQSCDEEAKCKNCDYVLPALGHAWEVASRTEASCTSRAVTTYVCKNCRITRNEETGEFAQHVLKVNEDLELVEGCKVTEQLKCENCPLVVEGTVHYEHNYVAKITLPTCVEPGSKTYECDKCHEPQVDEQDNPVTETLVNPDAHNWVETAEGSGVFHCQNDGCNAEKKTVNAVDKEVDKEALADANEMKLSDDGAAMAVDSDTLDKLKVQESIQVTVKPVDVTETSLSPEQQVQLPSGTVYNFEMKVDGTVKTEFETPITISLPYTPKEGEDLDAIDVWYIDDEGTVQSFKGVYSNGFVTFTTDHFSYYTVTRMTAAERCERYGHMWYTTQKDATCTEDGYTLVQCQRCAKKDTEETLHKTGHDYQETVKAATCTEEGEIVKICQNKDCKSYLYEKLPVLGHNMVKSDQSQAATCDASGKDVYVCDREGCDKQVETVLAQLTHSFKLHDERVADCVNKGYRQNKCEHCGKIETEYEKVPLGHEYLPENAVWVWSEDHKSATVTLVCSHDSSHTKTLTAVVTSVTKSESSCLGGGAVVYTAVAEFNKVEYTNVVTITQAAVGHKPGSNWTSDENNHWHVCSVCSEKTDVAFHSWNEGKVTTAPTCAEAGETLYTCTVCGQEKTVTVKATGAHDYHFGVCKNCGFGKSTCTHEAVHQTPADMSQYGLCDGAVFYWISCDCGENKYLVFDTINCNLGEPVSTEQTDAYGQKYVVDVFTCPDCGLIGESSSYAAIVEGECAAFWTDTVRLIKDGVELFNQQYVYELERYEHPTVITAKTTDMSEFGLCGMIVTETVCPCGQNVGLTVDYQDGCNFEFDGESQICTVCGAEIRSTAEWQENEQLCLETWNYTFEINKGGEKVYGTEWSETRSSHSETALNYEMAGATCEEGLVVTLQCDVCGKTRTVKTDSHIAVITKEIDLSGYNICTETLVQAVCPCGAIKESYQTGENICQWSYYGMTEEGEPEYAECWICGATQTRTYAYGEKNEWCDCVVYITNRYQDKDGNEIATTYDIHNTVRHNYDTTVTLLGTTCEDGILIVEDCKDCEHYDERQENWHYSVTKETFDLSAFDMCATKGVVRGCPCGENEGFEWLGGYCKWEHVEGNMNTEIQRCMECGVVMKSVRQMGKAEDPCHTLSYVTLEFSRDGVSLGKFGFDQRTTNHYYVVDAELVDSAAGCIGGVRGTETCIICGQTSRFEIFAGEVEHPEFNIEMDILCGEGLCGTLTWVKRACPCGEASWEGESWHGGYCEFEGQRWNEELGQWVSVCSNCDAERYNEREESRVEGTTCMMQALEHVWLYKDGELLCQYDRMHTYEEHRFVASFEMLGDTCEDGYTVNDVCALCGETGRNDEIRYSCEERVVDLVTVVENDNICQNIYAQLSRCACGKIASANLTDWNCNFEHVGFDEETNEEIWRCQNCGLERVGREYLETTPGSCDAQKVMVYTYYLNGEEVGSINKTYNVKHHNTRYNFGMQGQSCEDGFTVSEQCLNCDYRHAWEDMRYGHEWFNLYREELALYGMCGGEIGIHGCACGKEGSWYYNEHCRWEGTNNVDPDTGLREVHCTECDTYAYWGTVGQVDQNCVFTGNLIFKATRDGQMVLNVCEPIREYRHTYRLLGANFDTDRNCSNGVTVLRGCSVCGITQEDHIYHHEDFTADEIDLTAEGFCGGELRMGGCACGQSDFFHFDVRCSNMIHNDEEFTDADGVHHQKYSRECSDCGLKVVEENYSRQVEGCDYIHYQIVEIYKNGQLIKTMSREVDRKQHTPGTITYSLAEGATNCMDGVNLSWNCEYCGEHITGYTQGHGMNATDDIIDLTPYGSICGATLQKYECPCGEKKEYRFGEDCKCDITTYRDTLWITDAINGDQPNVDEGHVWLESYAERVGCGVTDPNPCGLELYKATYWLAEDCIATQYETWRMGYDAAADTWDKEITVATGEQKAWHDFQWTSNDQRVNGTGIYTWKENCPDCGSFREVTETWQNGQLTKRVEEFNNTLNFGTNRSRYSVEENGLEVQSKVNPGMSFWMPSESKTTWTRLNGDVFEEEWIRTYDFTGYCKSSTTYKNSYGETWSNQDEHAHTILVDWEVGTQATCTQFGELVRPCLICGYITDWERMPMEPTMHNFQWDEAKAKYVCSVCELESVRDYSGSIAMEELSDETSTDYVIGYWNRDSIEFMPTVSVMLYDVAQGENDELVLMGIEFTYHNVDKDGFNGLSFSKAAVQTAANQAIAEAGYSGSYGIRISFVPIDSQDELDYAITFDTQTTAE